MKAGTLFVLAGSAFVALGVGLAFLLLGTPMQSRQIALDEQRVDNLRQIAADLHERYEKLNRPLPEQTAAFTLASTGVGSRIRIRDHFNGSVDVGVPLVRVSDTKPGDILLTFRGWADF